MLDTHSVNIIEQKLTHTHTLFPSSCKHFNIDPSADGQFVMGTLTFPTIQHIITHYQQNSLFIHDSQHVTLSQPATKKRSRMTDSSRHAPNS